MCVFVRKERQNDKDPVLKFAVVNVDVAVRSGLPGVLNQGILPNQLLRAFSRKWHGSSFKAPQEEAVARWISLMGLHEPRWDILVVCPTAQALSRL